MPRKFELKRGFLRLQRLGPIKFGEQSRWAIRAPESTGLWAFPYPNFDYFYAYHRYRDLLPKNLQGDFPRELKYWRRERRKGEDPFNGVHELHDPESAKDYPLESLDEIQWEETLFRDRRYPADGFYCIGAYYEAQEEWIEKVGKRILPLREFWYRGELYTHFKPDGSVGSWTMSSKDPDNEWTLMSTDRLARLMRKPGGVAYSESYGEDGKPRVYSFSKDHLEVFIPRGRGEIRDRI